MRAFFVLLTMGVTATGGLVLADGRVQPAKNTWSVKADYIEACSCSMFCSCYFNDHPEGGMKCEFNNAVKIASANVGDVVLDGKKFWISGDLGGDFKKPLKSAVVTFDTGTTKAEKDAILFLVQKIYPLKWKSVKTDEAKITWVRNGMNGHAVLGNKGEVTLKGIKGEDGKQVVIRNLKYWGADKCDGFELAYGTHHYKGNGHNYSHENRNGFFVHIESSGTK